MRDVEALFAVQEQAQEFLVEHGEDSIQEEHT
jgi:hypothetical protein